MELLLFIGIQATGKSSFYRERFYRTHVRVNLDMLKTRHREKLLVQACTPFVVDNTNLTREDRTRYIAPAKAAGFAVHGYFFQSRVTDALVRNAQREANERVPELGYSWSEQATAASIVIRRFRPVAVRSPERAIPIRRGRLEK